MNTKRHYIGLLVAVLSLGMLLTGGTYAWLLFADNTTITGEGLNAQTTCFIMDYSGDFPISNNTIFPSKTDKGGLSGTVTINIKESCNVSATGNIYLNVGSATSSTLLSSGALKYAFYDGSNTLIGSGTISSSGVKTLNTSAITLTKAATTYTVYVWLDGTKVNNSHLGLSFSGYIYADAMQVES